MGLVVSWGGGGLFTRYVRCRGAEVHRWLWWWWWWLLLFDLGLDVDVDVVVDEVICVTPQGLFWMKGKQEIGRCEV